MLWPDAITPQSFSFSGTISSQHLNDILFVKNPNLKLNLKLISFLLEMSGRAATPSCLEKEQCDLSLALLLHFFSVRVDPLKV